jgi:hypothetical protein
MRSFPLSRPRIDLWASRASAKPGLALDFGFASCGSGLGETRASASEAIAGGAAPFSPCASDATGVACFARDP